MCIHFDRIKATPILVATKSLVKASILYRHLVLYVDESRVYLYMSI